MLKRPEVRLAVLGAALLGSSLAWYLISPLFTSRQAYVTFPTLAVMASATPRLPTATLAPTETITVETVGSALAEAQLLAVGDFVALNYVGSGSAEVYALESGEQVLSLEGIEVEYRTDLHVLLTNADPAEEFTAAHVEESLDLGLLDGVSDQQFELPEGVMLSHYRTIVIWCDPEQVPYMAAELRTVAEEQPTPES
ncbi:MAG: DM13 domain-containing protein [Anaerolineales bacterium]|nr:MAG: DM13 domain-containing protein [Anaerolineales bacterium]